MNRRGGETARNSAEEAEEEDTILYSRKADVETNQLDKVRYNRMENQSVNTNKSEPGKNTVKGYHEHFQTKGNKKIYILGDVGTGKSTFCKMMIENWCDAVKSSTNELICFENGHDATKAVSSDVNRKSEYDNVSQVAQYEFLFYIPLQYMSAFKSDSTVEMIKEITRDLTSNSELIDKIFQEDSMRCLIIADSLDEWTPPKEIVCKPHVSYGIPNGDKTNDATVITLSRPSAKGILNLENSEVDLKLQLLGISGDSLRSFIERYISNTHVTNKTYDEFIKKLEIKHIEHVVKTPLILQQLLWLYCNGEDIGKSVCETHCVILNIMFAYSDRRKKGPYLIRPIVDYNNLNPINSLNRFPRIQEYIPILFRLGKIAFETCTSDKVQATFGLSNLEMHLSEDDIKQLTDLGILNKSRCFGRLFEETKFSFSHICDIEFFAALYLAIYYGTAQTASTNREDTALDLLFLRCKLTCDVIQLSNLIKLFCGLSPDIIGSLSKRISSIVNEDGHILQHRRNEDIRYHDVLIQIQRLMVLCLNEFDSDNTTIISLSDLYISGDEPIPPLHKINPEYVISLYIDFSYEFGEYNKDVGEYVTKCKHMQNMHVSLNPFNQYQRFPYLFAEKVYLKQLRLSNVTDCDIDLSMVNRLQALVLTGCSYIDISNLDTEHLESINIIQCDGFSCFLTASNLTDVYIEKCHGSIDMTSLQSVIQNAAFLRQLTLDSVTDTLSNDYINIDLSRHHQLQKLKIKNCLTLVITGLNTEQLEQVYIVNSDLYGKVCTHTRIPVLEFAHASAKKLSKVYLEDVIVNIASLIPLLEQAPLQHLTIIRVSDGQPNFEDHLRGVSDQPDGEGHLKRLSGKRSDGVQPKVGGCAYILNLSTQNELTHLMIESCDQIKISTINVEKHEKQSTSFETLSTGSDQLFSYTENISENKGTLCKEVKEIGKIVNQDELDRICESRDRKDKLVVQCCESICNIIKSSSEYIFHVYAAYKKENERKIFFVVTVMWDFDLNENDIGYRMMKRNYGDLSTEGIDISSSTEEREQIMSDDENKKLSACISKYAGKLMDNHRYLNVISGSIVRSKNYKPSAMCFSKQSCIALYVLVKGFIPIEEDAFQNTYDGVEVDIREGLFFPYGTAREYHDDIKMGCKITRFTGIAGDLGGTLGGFIDHPSYGVCGITCAHALMFPDELRKCVEHNREITWPKIFSSDIVCQPNIVSDKINKIGRIVQAIYKEGDQSEAGVEVAVIQIEDRPPISGHFPGIGPNGINIPYTFETGKTCGVSRVLGKDLFKFGCISDFTQGRIKSTPVCVRTFEFEHNGFTIRLLNQLEIETEKFATHGDSGSLVFCKGMSGDFECVGMVEGGVSYKTCIITPIQSILAALKVSSLKDFEIKKTKHQLDAIDNRVSSIETKVNSMHSLLLSFTQKNSNDQAK
ncbi:uncharacterized protein LOC132740174 isoform X2 [Ruditapes philippinarum]|uniref:uncharacterized protein LOC132740174 isoform X2 n=1 Tax=Ruditapes philippinarum TaxID=129788 RepID=UPI00295B8FE1|nr:uncharacterized protein LOC132740174 isoform X2 [Ruditapes philippinarum]